MSLRIPRETALQQEQDRGRAEPRNPRIPITLMAFGSFWMLIGLLIAALLFLLIIAIIFFY